jgi:predicted metal-dependent hydrolase
MSISNARLFQQAQESLEAERRASGELSRQAWAELIRQSEELVYRGRQGAVSIFPEGEGVPVSDELPTISVPVRVRGHAVAMIQARKPEVAAEWTSDESEIIDALAEQLGVALESARLYQDTQRRAAQERVIGDVTARMRETLDIDAVLRTAVREIGESLALHDITVRLEAEDDGVE